MSSGREAFQRAMKVWGLAPEASPRQCLIWRQIGPGWQRQICGAAGLGERYVYAEFHTIPEKHRVTLWRELNRLSEFADVLKECET